MTTAAERTQTADVAASGSIRQRRSSTVNIAHRIPAEANNTSPRHSTPAPPTRPLPAISERPATMTPVPTARIRLGRSPRTHAANSEAEGDRPRLDDRAVRQRRIHVSARDRHDDQRAGAQGQKHPVPPADAAEGCQAAACEQHGKKQRPGGAEAQQRKILRAEALVDASAGHRHVAAPDERGQQTGGDAERPRRDRGSRPRRTRGCSLPDCCDRHLDLLPPPFGARRRFPA